MREFVYSHSHIFDETGVLRSYSVRLHSFVAKEMKKQSCDSKGMPNLLRESTRLLKLSAVKRLYL